MTVLVTNNAFGTLSAGITNSQTTLTLQTGQGARFPVVSGGNSFYGTLANAAGVLEIVQVTGTSGDTMTVVRGVDASFPAQAYSSNDRFELRPTAQLFNSKVDSAYAAANYVGIASPNFTGTPTISGVPIATQSFVSASYLTTAGAATTYAPINSPAFTGVPTAPTAAPGINSNQIATTAFVVGAIGGTGFAPTASPVFTGTPTAPTGAYVTPPGTGTVGAASQLATEAWVMNQLNTGSYNLNAATATLTATAGGLTGNSPVLGAKWQIDANFQLSNNADTMYRAAWYNSANATGALIPFDTVMGTGNTAGLGSMAAGTLTLTNIGTYDVSVSGVTVSSGSNLNPTVYFGGTATYIVGPTSGTPQQFYGAGANGAVFTYFSARAIVRTTAANQTLTCSCATQFAALKTGMVIVQIG